jgi:hypothetical protein
VALTLPAVALDEAALDHALDVVAETQPEPVERARAALDVILDGVRRSPWSDVAWCASALSPNGYPVQFVVDVGGDLGYVAEVAGPQEPAAGKLARALEVLKELGTPPLPDTVVAAIDAAQRSGELRSGTWLGASHGPERDEYTLYVEVPPAGQAELREVLVPAALLSRVSALGRLETVGIGADTGRIELYCACESTDARLIGTGMIRVGLGDRADDLIALVERTPMRPGSLLLQRGSFGLAVSIVDARPERFMVVAPARRMLGRDRDTRRRVLELAGAEGWDLSTYAALTRGLEADWPHRVSVHGLLAWTVAAASPPAIRLAFAPLASDSATEGGLP